MENHRAQYKPGDFSLGQVHEFLGAFGRQSGTPELLQTAIEDADLMARLVKLMKGSATDDSVFPVTIDYGRSIEEMVVAGKYDWKNSDINAKNFPMDGKGVSAVNIELVHFNRIMESDDVLRELDKMGLRPATLPELLAFGATYPKKQRESSIVALGSLRRHWSGGRYVAYLYGFVAYRGLSLNWFSSWWDADDCFAAVRKTEEYPIAVNYDHRLERMIEDGHYDWKNSEITAKNFPVDGKGISAVNIELVHFNRTMESDDVLRELDKQGLRPATLPELLAFGAKYPEKQREFPIVALGSVWRGFRDSRYVASLRSGGSGRRLDLSWIGSRWGAVCSSAAVRK